VQPFEEYAHIDADDVPLVQEPLGAGDAVHDLFVDRGTQRLREPVEALEGWLGPWVTADEALGDPIQLPVLIPGRTLSCIRASVWATMCPARAMISISRGDLMVIIRICQHVKN
jgi:hypothetical protein